MSTMSAAGGAGPSLCGAPPTRNADEARHEGNRLYEAGDFAAAQLVFEQLLQAADANNWCLFQLGRIASRQRRWADAVAELDQALACENPIVWAYLERAMALHELGARVGLVVRDLASFARQAPQELAEAHYAVLLQGAHRAFEARAYEEAGTLYDLLVRRGCGGYFCKLRRAHVDVLTGRPEEGLRALDQLASDPGYDLWGDVVRSRALLALGQYPTAATLMKTVVARAPGNVDLVRLLFTALERSADKTQLSASEQFLDGLSTEQRFEFRLWAKLACEDFDGAARLCCESPTGVTGAGAGLLSNAINTLVARREFATIDRLLEKIEVAGSRSPQLISAALSARFERKDWSGAEQLLRSVEQIPEHNGHSQLRLRRLQLFCFTLQLDKAEAVVSEWGAINEVPEIASATVATLYAALGRWDKVLELFRDRVVQGFAIAQDVFLKAVARAARHTDRYAEVVELVNDALATRQHATLGDFRNRLLAEATLRRSLCRAGSASEAAAVSDPPLDAVRTQLAKAALTGPCIPNITDGIYLCTDLNYLIGAAVAVCSLLRNNPGAAKEHSLTVVCSDDAMRLATAVFQRLADAFSVPISLRRSASLIEKAYRFRTGWGLFTPGEGLSEAAYFRIFAVQQMIAAGAEGRALYLDCDTCIGPGLKELFGFDLRGQPLGARPELPLPEIRHAAIRLGLDPTRYFNSGVLLFDLSHPDLPDLLARTIDIAVNNHEMLTFVDQCALNVAFHEHTAMLPEACNAFVRPQDDTQAVASKPVVLHYLEQPKPWDPFYPGINCMRWVREFAALGQVVASDHLKQLLSVQFTRGRDPIVG